MPIRDIAAQNLSLDNDYGVTRGPNAPDSHQVALFVTNPALGGVEVSGPGYARVTLNSDGWAAAVDGAKTVTVTFPNPTGAWTQATYWGLYDPVGADWWDCAPLASALNVTGASSGPVIVLAVYYDNL